MFKFRTSPGLPLNSEISPGAYIIRRVLSTEGNLRFKIDWASVIVGSKFTQHDGRRKRRAKRLSVTNVTGVLS